VGASLPCNLGYIPRYLRHSTAMPSKKLYEIHLRRAFVVRIGDNFCVGGALSHSNILYSIDFLTVSSWCNFARMAAFDSQFRFVDNLVACRHFYGSSQCESGYPLFWNLWHLFLLINEEHGVCESTDIGAVGT